MCKYYDLGIYGPGINALLIERDSNYYFSMCRVLVDSGKGQFRKEPKSSITS